MCCFTFIIGVAYPLLYVLGNPIVCVVFGYSYSLHIYIQQNDLIRLSNYRCMLVMIIIMHVLMHRILCYSEFIWLNIRNGISYVTTVMFCYSYMHVDNVIFIV